MLSDNKADDTLEGGIIILNEFASVVIRKIYTRNGIRLEIYSPRLGRAIQLDALALESLTWQTPDLFTELLKDPFGPGDEEK